MKRRAFFTASVTTGAITVLLPGCSWVPVIPKRPTPSLSDAASWVRYQNGRYTLHMARAEMGQHITTAFKQIACDELDAPWDKVDVELLHTAHIARVKGTVGSDSIREFALPLAQACATLRRALTSASSSSDVMAAENIPMTQLRAFSDQARWVGRRAPQVQGMDIVTGQPLYAADVRRPGMVYGKVLRAPASPELGSRPTHWDAEAARRVPGFIALVQDARLIQCNAQGLGILAQTPGALDRVETALAVQWAVDPPADARALAAQLDVAPRLSQGALAHVTHQGDMDVDGPWTVDLRLEVPLAPHNAMEPRAAVAELRSGTLTMWAGAQDPFYQRDVIARALALPADKVVMVGMRIGGGFGGKTLCTVELEAAVLAQQSGRTVKVQWTRVQELAQGFHRPPSSHRVRARMEKGQLTAWWHAFSSSHILFTGAAMPPWMQQVTLFVGDPGVARGSALPYRCAQQRTEYDLTRLSALTGPWRGLGAAPNQLAMESAVDECARAARADPLEFRLRHLSLMAQPRLRAVLERVAGEARWPLRPNRGGPGSPSILRGGGLACGVYKGISYAAAVAEVEVDTRSGAIRVTHLWCAHDCGRMINPDQVAAQVEGNLVWSIGLVLKEELPFEQGRVRAQTFADAPMPRITDMAQMHVALIDSREAPSGAGETAIVAGGAAIANALRDATGHRFNRVPVRPTDVLQALRL